jgi:predicted alpha/beta-hydrolase family hydrolase
VKTKNIKIRDDKYESSGVILGPDTKKGLGVVLAHGAGGNMNNPFMNYFQTTLSDAGYPTLKFNFFYSEAKRKYPDSQPLLMSCFEKAIAAMPQDRLIIGGKSMGGRIASYVADDPRVAGLLFLGYPLHPPGKTDQLRDQHLFDIGKPMMFVSGTKDPFAKLDLLERTVKKIGRNAQSYLVEGGGHSLEVRGKKDTLQGAAAAILEWLRTI